MRAAPGNARCREQQRYCQNPVAPQHHSPSSKPYEATFTIELRICAARPSRLRQSFETLLKAIESQGNSSAFLRLLKNRECGIFAIFHLLDELFHHHHFGDAAGRKTAHEAGAADILIVDLESEAGRQEDTERRDDTQQTALAVRR